MLRFDAEVQSALRPGTIGWLEVAHEINQGNKINVGRIVTCLAEPWDNAGESCFAA